MPVERNKKELRIEINGQWHDVVIDYHGKNQAIVTVDNEPVEIRWENLKTIDQKPAVNQTSAEPKKTELLPSEPIKKHTPVSQNSKNVTAPMPGRIIGISVKALDQVSIGDEICILEAMKMQQTISASISGTVKSVLVQPGDTITAGQTIVEFE